MNGFDLVPTTTMFILLDIKLSLSVSIQLIALILAQIYLRKESVAFQEVHVKNEKGLFLSKRTYY